MTFASFVGNIIGIMQIVIILIIALTLLYFLWGIVKYIGRYGDETARKESIQMMINGIIALFVMIAVWGFVYIVFEFFILDSNIRFGIPQF